MILQAEAERKKRASILTSEGDKLAAINIAEAEKLAQVLKAEGTAESLIVQAKAQADALQSIDEQLQKPAGFSAAQFLLGQRYIDAYKSVGKKETTIILETDPINVKKQVEESLQTLSK